MNQPVVCTIVTRSYIPFARALAQSLMQHHPNCQLYVLMADRMDDAQEFAHEPFQVIRLDDLPDRDLVHKMCFYYTPFELCCALRGVLHQYMYEQAIADRWLFLDSDILVFNSLDIIFQQLESAAILLTPHIQVPVAAHSINPLEISILISGIYNAGFLGLSRTSETQKFIAWFKHRLAHYGFSRRGKGHFNSLGADQLWLNFVPQFFQGVEQLLHPGANVAYWNLPTRSVTKQNDSYYVDGQPLLFVHFSGWSVEHPQQLCKFLPDASAPSYWSEWGNSYKTLLLNCEYERFKSYPYGFGTFADGRTITPEMRYFYYEQVQQHRAENIDPFVQPSDLAMEMIREKITVFRDKALRKSFKLSKQLFAAIPAFLNYKGATPG